VRYELDFFIPEDDILHSHHRENLKSYKLRQHLPGRPKVTHKKSQMIVAYILPEIGTQFLPDTILRAPTATKSRCLPVLQTESAAGTQDITFQHVNKESRMSLH
jgi:hypothetical protein